jgi:hypothetical protein
VDYQIDFENCDYDDSTNQVYLHGTYPVLSDNVKNSEYLNEYIQEQAMYMWNYYLEEVQPYETVTAPCEWSMISYVTYNDNSLISIVIEESWYQEDTSFVDVTSINLDLERGMILDNDGILNTDEAFAIDFMERSNAQNGELDVFNYLTTLELSDFLTDPTSSIICYTPYGMEVGFRYTLGTQSGWVTVTYPDYQDFLKTF